MPARDFVGVAPGSGQRTLRNPSVVPCEREIRGWSQQRRPTLYMKCERGIELYQSNYIELATFEH